MFLPLLLGLLNVAVTVPTAQYNNQRTGANTEETVLTPRNVTPATFGNLVTVPLDGDVFAQPLYVNGAVYAATEHNSVYAISPNGDILWRVNFGKPMPFRLSNCGFIAPEIGITPTPVIDVATKTIYVLVRTEEQERYYQRLHAIDITNGAERPGSPVLIRASVQGSLVFGLMSKEITFHSVLENPRAALLLANGTVYVAWGSSCDFGPYYGWVLGYDARSLKQTSVFNTAPDAGQSGIWQGDAGMAADDQGNVYAVTGNGKFNPGRDYGDTALQLNFSHGANPVVASFTPENESALNRADDDLGTTGPILLPGNLVAICGKDGVIRLLNRHGMKQVQQLPALPAGAYGAGAFWNGHLYYFARNDVLRDFALFDNRLPNVSRASTFRFAPGSIPVVSANGTRDAIVWTVLTKAWNENTGEARLQAYDADNIARPLLTLPAGSALRFTMPLIADGRVYVGTRGALLIYGLLKPAGRQ